MNTGLVHDPQTEGGGNHYDQDHDSDSRFPGVCGVDEAEERRAFLESERADCYLGGQGAELGSGGDFLQHPLDDHTPPPPGMPPGGTIYQFSEDFDPIALLLHQVASVAAYLWLVGPNSYLLPWSLSLVHWENLKFSAQHDLIVSQFQLFFEYCILSGAKCLRLQPECHRVAVTHNLRLINSTADLGPWIGGG